MIPDFPLAPLRQARYRLNVATPTQLPPDSGAEVAFVGRSNVGKSSVLNAITDQKRLARTSSRPGCTQQLVFFDVDEERRLVDLPGYGYARAPLEAKSQWGGLIRRYLTARQCLKGLVLIMDIRHPFTDFDQQMLDMARQIGLPAHIILNKADKLSRSAAMQTLARLRKQHAAEALSMQLFSATAKSGIVHAHEQLAQWLDLALPEAKTAEAGIKKAPERGNPGPT